MIKNRLLSNIGIAFLLGVFQILSQTASAQSIVPPSKQQPGLSVLVTTLTGVGFANEATQSGITYLSMAGGARVQIHGDNMGSMPNMNSILFYSATTPGVAIPGPVLSQDDEFSSNSMMGILSYTTPSVMTLLGRTWDQLNGQSGPLGNPPVDFTVNINNRDEGGGELACVSQSKCSLNYQRDFTPVLMYTTPNEVYAGQLLQFHINAKYASSALATPAGQPPIVDIRLAGYLTDMSPIDQDFRLAHFSRDRVEVFVGNNPPAENSEPKILLRNGYAQNLSTLRNCNFAGDKCWTIKTHPVITSVSANSGNTVGGQELTIKGFGFNGTDATVSVDGVVCAVKTRTNIAITCITGVSSAVSYTNRTSPGQPGLKQSLYIKADGTNMDWPNFIAANLINSTLYTSFETYDSMNYQEIRGQTLEGWFTAPSTGNYRFYTSCDDVCQVFLDSANPYNAAAFITPAPTMIAYRYGALQWRNYWFNETSTQVSAWIPLTAGQSYYMKGQTIEYTGGDHFTVSVEIEKANAASHPMAMKQIQKLQVLNVANTFESWAYLVSTIDSGTFKFNLLNPSTLKYWQSIVLQADAPASRIQNALSGYTQSVYGCGVTVTRQQFNSANVETLIAADVKSYKYNITLNKLIIGSSANAISITKITTKSTFSITTPANGIKSSAPIQGSYIISCTDAQGVSWSTEDIPVSTPENWIQNAITNKIPFLADKIEVAPDYLLTHKENGISFNLKFSGLTAATPLCTVKSGLKLPLTGNSPTFSNRAVTTYGQSLFFEPIPLEFLSTPEVQPQIKVSVAGNQALCKGMDCNYIYTSPVEAITENSLTGNSLSLTGTEIPAILEVTVGGAVCGSVVATATSVACTFTWGPPAGTWTPKVRTAKGSVPNTGLAVNVPLVATSVTPNIGINYLGGETLTIVGSGFGADMALVSVKFADQTVCQVTSLTATKLKCEVKPFTTIDVAPSVITITVNGVVDNTLSITQVAAVQQSISLSPNSVSPVLKSTLTIALASNYPTVLKVADLKATLLSDTNATFTKDLYIMSVDDAAKTVKVKFGGANSGLYYIQLSSTQYGRITRTNLLLTVGSSITSITPTMGSMYGGTLVTITGVNFSTDPLDNPVKVGPNYCLVLTSSATQITCRIVEIATPIAATAQNVFVFLKTSEEAKCTNTCLFEYVTPMATTTGIAAAFDAASQTTQVTVSGSGFDSPAELVLDGVKQNFVSATDTQAIFTVTSFETQTPLKVKFYSSQGIPQGASAVANPSLKITPTLISLTPEVGSAAGTVVKVMGSGFGSLTTTLNLWGSASGNVCSKVTYVSQESLLCTTNAVVLASGELKLNVGNAQLSAANTALTQFSQTKDIAYTDAVLSGNTITFTGTNFPTTATVLGTYGGVTATSGTSTNTSAVLTFGAGIPVSSTAIAPTLYFKNADSTQVSANPPTTPVTIANPLTVVSSTAGLSCSFAGGCAYTVTGNGLFSTLQQTGNQIDVCGTACILSKTLSDASKAVCLLPTISTTYSVKTFKTAVPAVVTGTLFPADPKLTDGKLTVDHVDASKTTCNFGMSFAVNHKVVLDEQKVFINKLFDKTPFVNNLVFQGSNDGTTWTDITTFGNEIHEGWNYVSYREMAEKPTYNQYRYWGKVAGSCRVGEFRLTGVDVIANNDPTYTCTPDLIIAGIKTPLTAVTFDGAKTSTLTSISPRFGTVTGGTTVTFTGTNFDAITAGTSVLIDKRACVVGAVTATTITCVTATKPYVADTPALIINQPGFGNVATAGLVFRYVSLYSNPITWGGDAPPGEGESISIPKGQHLLIDIDTSPKLNAIIVEGSLIFAPNDANPNHQRTFDARYIMVQGGYMEVGTEEFPYTSKLTITMHSDKFSPYLPTYGNKVIGVRFGVLEMHGVVRPITWTEMKSTVAKGATSIELTEVTDWKVGERIVIATTSFSNDESETRIIKTITGGKVITFEDPLLYKHISEFPLFGEAVMPMACQVGLLSRNVIYRGDPETSSTNQYGAHIMIHSPGDESAIGRIEYIELTDVGQAFKLGRYPLHFHMIGTVNQSYVKGNAIWNTYNRAVTLHGIHYFRIINNVAFNTMGHTIFVEDAVETRNYIYKNLIVQVKSSFSLLNTDWTPGGMWITHPNNIFVSNVVAGSDAYGFWFDMQDTSIGPSYSPNICPFGETLGEFRDNTAHSVRKYGLRIHHGLLPREIPCKTPVYNKLNITDPYYGNRPILANFQNFVGWKAGKNCAITEDTGYVQYTNFKCADSAIAGIEFSRVLIADGYAKISGGMIIGNTGLNNDDGVLGTQQVWGVITPRTEGMTVENVKFYNFNFQNSGAIGDCSHCFHPAATDSGARTVRTKGLVFDATVPKKISYQLPWRGIFLDLDGSLTGLGPNSWATPNWAHNRVTECTVSTAIHDGLVCSSAAEVRRVVFYGPAPKAVEGRDLKISKWDDADVATLKSDNATYTAYLLDKNRTNFSQVPMKAKLDPVNSWAIPFVTGHTYRLHWGDGNDFTEMKVALSNQWLSTDKDVVFVTNHTDVRQGINVTTISGLQILNNTYTTAKTAGNLTMGDNIHNNDTATREFKMAINAKDATGDRNTLKLLGLACVYNCVPTVEVIPISDTTKYWSNMTTWPSGKLPVEGDEVVIKPGDWVVLDLVETPILNKLVINGRLSFQNDPEDGKNINLRARLIHVQAGELLIGNSTNPFNASFTAQVTLYGKTNDPTLLLGGSVEAGNKVLATNGLVSMFGAPVQRWSRLTQSAFKNDAQIFVEPFLNWKVGERIYIAQNTNRWREAEYMNIVSYNNSTGEIKLGSPIQYYHYGEYESTASRYDGIDIRAEVILLSRNVKVVGSNEEAWGATILASDALQDNGQALNAQIIFDNVEMFNCSQRDNKRAALRFEGTFTKQHTVTNSVAHEGLGWGLGISGSLNIKIEKTAFVSFSQQGVNVQGSSNINFDGVFTGDVKRREVSLMDQKRDLESCFSVCTFLAPGLNAKCTNVNVINSIVAGCPYAGFVVRGHECGQSATQQSFRNNVAHSIDGTGAHIVPNSDVPAHYTCYEGSHFKAYKTLEPPISTMYKSEEIRHTNMVFVDTVLGASLQTGEERPNLKLMMENIHFYGESEAEDCPLKHPCRCWDKSAFMLASGNRGAKAFHIETASGLPSFKIKSYGTWNVKTEFTNMVFENFSNQTRCGARQRIFEMNEHSSDSIPMQVFKNAKFINVTNDAVAFLMDPVPEWAKKDDCGTFPCTAPSNVVMQFTGASFSGANTPKQIAPDFQIISDTEGVSNTFASCKNETAWNAFICTNPNLAVLMFESLDADTEDRSIQPIYIINDATGSKNTLNSMMDHMWDGFYSGQVHLSRFPAMIEVKGNLTVEMTGTPPGKMRYVINGGTIKSGVKVKVPYWNAGSYEITVDSNVIPYTPWDTKIGRNAELTLRKGCGENRFVGVQNFLEFYITPGCVVYVSPRNAIMGGVRLEWTMSEFYSTGGVVSFTDRVAFVLGIHASQIKIVAVYEGSVVIDYMIMADKEDRSEAQTLKKLNTLITGLVQSEAAAQIFGAPVLSATGSGKPITITPRVNTNAKGGKGTSGANGANGANGVNGSNGASGNKAIFNSQNLPEVEQVTVTIVRPKISAAGSLTVADSKVSGSDQQLTNTNLYVIIGVVGGILLVVGAGVLTFFLVKRNNQQQVIQKIVVRIEANGSGNDVSQPELEMQYHPQAVEEITVFTKRDNIKKANADELEDYDCSTTRKLHNISVVAEQASDVKFTGVQFDKKEKKPAFELDA